MKKIRINELARELEVKAHEILERLPEVGVSEKKTHSSSIDEDAAIRLRRLYGHDVPDYVPDESDVAVAEHREVAQAEPTESGPAGPVVAAGGPPAQSIPPDLAEHPQEAPAAESPATGETRSAAPIRPPVVAPPAGAPATPAVRPPGPPPAVIAPGRPAPPFVKPLPTGPRPGQVLSGPRQPFPSAPAGAAVPGPPAAPRPGAVSRPHPQAPAEARRPAAPTETARAATPLVGPLPQRTLAGQPTARPV